MKKKREKRRPEAVPVMRQENGGWVEGGETVVPSWRSLLERELARRRFELWENPSAAFIAGRAWANLTSTPGMTEAQILAAPQLHNGIPLELHNAIVRADADWIADFAAGIKRQQDRDDSVDARIAADERMLQVLEWIYCNPSEAERCGSTSELVDLLRTSAGIHLEDTKRLGEKLLEIGLKLGV